MEEFFPGSFLWAKTEEILNKKKRTEWGSNMYVEPPNLAEKEPELADGTKKVVSIKYHLLPRKSARG